MKIYVHIYGSILNLGNHDWRDKLFFWPLCVHACVCVWYYCCCFSAQYITVTQPAKQEVMIMSKGFQNQTMIHFMSLGDTMWFDREQSKQSNLPYRDVCATVWETEEHWQSQTTSDGGGGTNKTWIEWTEMCSRGSSIHLSKCLGLIKV